MFLSIQEIVLISAGVVSKCNGRMVGVLSKIFPKSKNSLAILLDFS
jgi:hypothetical protein